MFFTLVLIYMKMLFLRFEEISYAVGYLATLTFPLLYLKPWQEHGTYNTQRKMVLFHSCKNAQRLSVLFSGSLC